MLKRPWLSAALWLLIPIAINIPVLLKREDTKIFATAALIIITGINLILVPATSVKKSRVLFENKINTYCDPKPLAVIAIFSILLTLCIFRGWGTFYTLMNVFTNSGLFIMAPIVFAICMILAESKEDKSFLINAIFFSNPLYITANVILYAAGFSGTQDLGTGMVADDRLNQTLSLVGITTPRVLFPLTSSVNGLGAISAISELTCIFYLMYGKGAPRIIALIFLPFVFSALILTDARGAIFASIAVGAAAIWLTKRPEFIKKLYILILIIPAVPSIAFRFFDLANNGGIFSFLIRSGSLGSRLGVGTGRGDIWKTVLTHLTEFQPIHIIGYGPYGQVTSNVSSGYSWIFNGIGTTNMSCHNTLLQYILDTGYIGCGAWLLLLTTLIYQTSRISRSNNTPTHIKFTTTSLLLFTLTQSQTEAFGTIYTPEMLLLILITLAASTFFTTNEVEDRSS